jgi:hypothetical protein
MEAACSSQTLVHTYMLQYNVTNQDKIWNTVLHLLFYYKIIKSKEQHV